MPAIHIRDLPEDVVAALKRRARRHHRSLQEELRIILASITRDELSAEHLAPLVLETSASAGDSSWRREEIYDADGR